ncbi:MAG: Hsp20/alpha crystallin family protein [Candidatus Diapherotrites archaeon]|nr:Hsp20/alpha crystallin family protein [Candidatus Diapherotrites archaeon]
MGDDEYVDEFERMRREMDSIFSRLFSGYDAKEPRRSVRPKRKRAELNESDEHLFVTMELHGFKKDDVNVDASHDQLEVVAQHKDSNGDESSSTASSQAMRFVLDLPVHVKEKDTQASFRNGVLEVRLTKAKPGKSRVKMKDK